MAGENMSDLASLRIVVRESGIREAERALRRLEDRANRGARSTDTLSRSIKGVGGAIAAYFSVQTAVSILKAADAFEMLQARVTRLSSGAQDAANNYSQLTSIAINSGTDLTTVIKLWEQLDQTLGELGKNGDEILQLTDTLNKLGVIGGSSIDDMRNSLRQFSQAMAGGILRAEEYNSLIENTPEIARAMARGLNMSMGEMRQAMLAGELTSERVFDAIQSQAERTNTEFDKMPRTIEQASTALSVNFGNAVAELDKQLGATEFVTKFLDGLGAIIDATAHETPKTLDGVIIKLTGVQNKIKPIGEALEKLKDGTYWTAIFTSQETLAKRTKEKIAELQPLYDELAKEQAGLENQRFVLQFDTQKQARIKEISEIEARVLALSAAGNKEKADDLTKVLNDKKEILKVTQQQYDLATGAGGKGQEVLKKANPEGGEFAEELKKRNMTKQQLLDDQYEAEKKKLDAFLRDEAVTQKQHAQMKIDLDKDYLTKKTAIEEQAGAEKKRQDAKDAAQLAADKEKAKQWLDTLAQRNMSEMELLKAKEQEERNLLQENYKLKLIDLAAFEQGKRDIEANYTALRKEEQARLDEENKSSLQLFIDDARRQQETFEGMWGNTFNNFTQGFGDAVAQSIMNGESFGDTMRNVARNMATSMISALVDIAAQEMILWALQKTIGTSGAATRVAGVTSEALAAVNLAGANAVASTAAIPVVGPGLAPAAGAAASAAASVFATAAIAAAGSGIAGARAQGGQVVGGSSYLVGEHGPEVVTMGGNGFGRVTPNHQLGGMGGINVQVNNYGSSSVETRQGTDSNGMKTLIIDIVDKVRSEFANDVGSGQGFGGILESSYGLSRG